jgi:hypothetical protein
LDGYAELHKEAGTNSPSEEKIGKIGFEVNGLPVPETMIKQKTIGIFSAACSIL